MKNLKGIIFSALLLGLCVFVNPNKALAETCEITSGDSLSTAITAANGGTVQLCQTIDVTTYVTINKDVTIDLNGFDITSNNDKTVLYVTDGAELTLTGAGNIKSGPAASATVWVESGTLNVQSEVVIENDDNGFALYGKSSTINISERARIVNSGTGTGLSIDGEDPVLNITGGAVDAVGDAITVFGTNPTVEISGGNIISQTRFALSGNGSKTTNSTINISGGSLTSEDSAAIYQPQTGELNITGGSASGKIAIAAIKGTVNVTGGTISATGTTDTLDIVEGHTFPNGVAIVVDSTDKSATATIGGTATIEATNENPVLAYGDEENENNLIVINTGVKFTGTSPKTEYLAAGLIVDKSGKVVDPSKVKEESTDNKKKPSEKNPATGDNLLTYVSLGAIALIGTLGTSLYLKKVNE